MAIMYIKDIDVRNLPDWFWDTLREAEGSRDQLGEMLMLMPNEKLREHFYYFRAAQEQLCDEPYTKFMEDEEGHLSEDGRDDMAIIAVSKGKEAYLKVLDKPELLAEMKNEWIDLGGVANDVYEERTGENFWDELME